MSLEKLYDLKSKYYADLRKAEAKVEVIDDVIKIAEEDIIDTAECTVNDTSEVLDDSVDYSESDN